DAYVTPSVPIAPLPDNASAIKGALAGVTPDGETPTALVLRGALEHSRSLLLGDPGRAVALALVTDGAPNACNSSAESVAAVASHGATVAPQVLTYVIGLETGYLDVLGQVAAAGGTGEPIIIDELGGAQALVDALEGLRDNLVACRYSVPRIADVTPVGSDITVRYRPSPDAEPVDLPRVASAGSCQGAGFWVDDPTAPTRVELCPTSCAAVHDSLTTRVIVRAGCGTGSGEVGGGPPVVECGGAVSFTCRQSCSSTESQSPECVGGLWTCPAGTVPSSTCDQCPPVPHGCCLPGDGLAQASCIDGAWVCPPGGVLFGEPGCIPPEVCAKSMPCGPGSYCEVDDYSCGAATTLGHCAAIPGSCAAGVEACGCDGQTYASACEAAQSAQHISAAQGCPTPAGHAPCGPLFCDIGLEACRETIDLTGGSPDDFACVPKPAGCPTGCGCNLCEPCPAGSTCGESCITGASGEAILTCTQAGG
ncbi:MAG: hypothetical protein KC731_30655, partial [Myxococcales bacterium]|nr:hypothetical protein [Myxococcales bacterium]